MKTPWRDEHQHHPANGVLSVVIRGAPLVLLYLHPCVRSQEESRRLFCYTSIACGRWFRVVVVFVVVTRPATKQVWCWASPPAPFYRWMVFFFVSRARKSPFHCSPHVTVARREQHARCADPSDTEGSRVLPVRSHLALLARQTTYIRVYRPDQQLSAIPRPSDDDASATIQRPEVDSVITGDRL